MGIIPTQFNRKRETNIRRLAPRQPSPTFPQSPVAGDIWYETDAKILWLYNGSGWVVILAQGFVAGTTNFLDGLELYHPAGTPYIDFHRSANAAGDSNADFNVRLINNAANILHVDGTAANVKLESNVWRLGVYESDWSYAHFGHRDWMNTANSRWQFLARNNGWVGVNASNGQQIDLSNDGNLKVWVRSDGIHSNDWMRCDTSGVGIYFAPGDGGWKMHNGDSWIYAHNDKDIYTGNHMRAGDAYMRTWGGGGGHSIFSCWGASNTKGFLTRNDGNEWVMMETQFFIRGNDGGDYFNFYRFGDVRLNVPTVPPGDPDLRIAGSHQLLRNASNRALKKNITSIKPNENPVWDIPTVRYHWKDDKRENGARFNARNPKGRPGFIAEDLFEVAPDATTVNDDGTPNGPDVWSLLAYIIAGMQELKKQVDKLEGKK